MTTRIRSLLLTLLLMTLCACAAQAATTPTLTLPAGIQTVDAEAFYKDTSINKLVIPEGATAINSRAFAQSGVKEVAFPESLTYIAEDAFDGCAKFKATAPTGSYAWAWCVRHGYISRPAASPAGDFEYETLNGLYAKITKYKGNDKVVVIPEEIDDYIIQRIDNNSFKGNTVISCVVIPDTVTSIGRSAFEACSNLISVDFGQGVETLERGAFYNCQSLKSVDLPASLKTTGYEVFTKCANLEFFGYPINWESADSSGRIVADCPKLTRIDVKEGTKSIPKYAFANCPNLKQINLPEGLEHVQQYAFSKCTGLTELIYPNTIKTVGGINGCTGIKAVSIPSGTITIGLDAFSAISLTSIVIPDSVINIEENAFYNCKNLATVKLGNSVETLGQSAFENCSTLQAVSFGNSLKSIGRYVFQNCTAMKEVQLPDTVMKIGICAFKNCENLVEFKYPALLEEITGGYWAPECYGELFSGCKKLKSITVPEGVKVIPEDTFRKSTYLRNIYLPSSLEEIGDDAFLGCIALTNIDLPYGLKKIGRHAFEGCTYLQKAIIPDTVISIGTCAYRYCENLAESTYPKNWDSVPGNFTYSLYGNIFYNCKKLERITVPEGVTDIPENAFRGCNYLKYIELPNGLKTVGQQAFEGCISLQRANLPDSVTSIGTCAYRYCENLIEFKYPKNLETIPGDWLYSLYGCILYDCKKIESVTVPEGVVTIPEDAFYGCNYLKNISLPSTIQNIGITAFKGCTVLEKLYLGYNINSIGKNAFSNCPVLTIWTEYGATALQYAKDNNIPYYYLTPDGVSSPSGTLYQGDSFPIYGCARSSVNLADVTGTIYDSAGKVVQTISVNPAATDYSLSGTVNTSLIFNTLALGNYRYKLSAKTNVSEEVWADNTFKIAPPPLRIYLHNYSISNGIVDVNSVSGISGEVISNYPITRLTVEVFPSTGTAGYNKTVTPNAVRYDLSGVASDIPLSKLPVGNYTIRITAVANGETRILADNTFQPVALDGAVDDDTMKAVAKFVANGDNANLFTTTYVNTALSRMDADEIFLMAVNTRSDWIYGYATKLLSGDNKYLVNLYEEELTNIIAEIKPNTLRVEKFDEDKKFFADAVLDYESDIFEAFKQGLMDRFNFKDEVVKKAYKEHLDSDFREIGDAIEGAKNALKAVEVSTKMADSLAVHFSTYVQGLEVLAMVSESMSISGNQEFKTAVMQLYKRYKSSSLDVTLTLLEQFAKDLLEESGKSAIKLMEQLVSDANAYIGAGTLYNIINFGIDLYMKVSGDEQVADDYMTFMIQVEAYESGVTAYREAFNKVQSGDTSAQAVNRLLVSFTYARQSGLRIHDTISKLKCITIDEANAVFDYWKKLNNAKIV